ncbi:MAG: S41 family peptidase [Acidobacteriota bacterium]
MKAIFSAILCFVTTMLVYSQQPQPLPDGPLDAATRSTVIKNLNGELNDGYIFLDTAKKMETDINERLSAGEYDKITTARAFAEKLTSDLQAISRDKHLRVRFSAQPVPIRKDRGEPTDAEKADFADFNKRVNYGFEKVERLQGNIGYLDLRGFFDPKEGIDTVAAAMTFVSNTDALIFDLRQNGGGDPGMVALICSYLFGDKAVHLNDLYFRRENKTDEFWTKPIVAGRKFLDKDVYLLTSNRTFSGAEEFSNNLKTLKRATIIGETTGGGANPGDSVRLTEHFLVFVPTGRAINPITKTNWEGTGVEPDVKVPKEQALKTAYIAALLKKLAAAKDDDTKTAFKNLIDQQQKELDEIKTKK